MIETVTENRKVVSRKLEERFIKFSINQNSIRIPFHKKESLFGAFNEETKDELQFENPLNLNANTQDVVMTRVNGIEIVETQKTVSVPTLEKEIPSEGDLAIEIK